MRAEFFVELNNPIYIKNTFSYKHVVGKANSDYVKDRSEAKVKSSIDGFNILTRFKPEMVDNSIYMGHKLEGVKNLIVSVEKKFPDERESIFAELMDRIKLKEYEEKDKKEEIKFFVDTKQDFRRVVCLSCYRFVSFFKFKLSQPFLDLRRIVKKMEVTWYIDSYGITKNDGSGLIFAPMAWVGEDDTSFGAIPYSHEFSIDLEEYIRADTNHTLSEKLISDAQQKIFEGEYQAAVLFLCMSCEMSVKEKFKCNIKIARSVLDKIVEEGGLITLDDFLNVLPRRSGILSMKEFDNLAYNKLKELIKLRNKIAHGIDMRNSVHLDKKMVEFWNSVEKFNLWLNEV